MKRVDLSLLPALEVLLEERSTTRAAKRLGMSQPAVSQALARLRRDFRDQLLVRTFRGLYPTELAVALRQQLGTVLRQADTLYRVPAFEPATANVAMRFCLHDALAQWLVPALCARLTPKAPGVRLHVGAMPGRLEALASDAYDVALALRPPSGHVAGQYTMSLGRHGYVLVARAKHPALRKKLTAKGLAKLRHVQVHDDSLVADWYAAKGVVPAATAPTVALALAWAAATEMVVMVPALLARALPSGVTAVPVPSPGPAAELTMAWPQHAHAEPRYVWLREEIRALIDDKVSGKARGRARAKVTSKARTKGRRGRVAEARGAKAAVVAVAAPAAALAKLKAPAQSPSRTALRNGKALTNRPIAGSTQRGMKAASKRAVAGVSAGVRRVAEAVPASRVLSEPKPKRGSVAEKGKVASARRGRAKTASGVRQQVGMPASVSQAAAKSPRVARLAAAAPSEEMQPMLPGI